MRRRRLRREAAHLEVTAYINLIVVLVPFLLSTAVFTRLSVLDLTLPAQSSGAVQQLQVDDLQLEVVIRRDALEVGDRIGGLIKRIPHANGTADVKDLNAVARELKSRFPDKTAVTVLAQPDTAYDLLVQVMDAMRAAGKAELFPDISIGDAPR
jgi:biopolymer transport protein ExbD